MPINPLHNGKNEYKFGEQEEMLGVTNELLYFESRSVLNQLVLLPWLVGAKQRIDKHDAMQVQSMVLVGANALEPQEMEEVLVDICAQRGQFDPSPEAKVAAWLEEILLDLYDSHKLTSLKLVSRNRRTVRKTNLTHTIFQLMDGGFLTFEHMGNIDVGIPDETNIFYSPQISITSGQEGRTTAEL